MSKYDFPSEPTSLVDAVLHWAVREKATDIHFSPFSEGCVIRARVDGLLRDLCQVHEKLVPKVISRVKVLAEMDIAERRKPQDGRITLDQEKIAVDYRVSSIPTLHGESLALRVLDRSVGLRTLDELGLPPREKKVFRGLLSQSNGMLITTGPTGAGKTTTLYAAIMEIASPERNVLTIENPVEYDLPRILQTSVQDRLGNTFAGLLRSILRHDPDVILVGEVRDPETAEISVRAALTGHLVLTSLHTERAAHAITALINFGVKPYALAPALRGVLAQQLIRVICPDCKTKFEYGADILEDPDFSGILPEGTIPSFSVGMGCDSCFQSGYRGRSGIFEVLEAHEAVRKRIMKSSEAEDIERAAVESGMTTLRRNGFRAVLEGWTTVEEVVRVIRVE